MSRTQRSFQAATFALALASVLAAGCDTNSSGCSGPEDCALGSACQNGKCVGGAATDLDCAGCVEEDELAFTLASVAHSGACSDLDCDAELVRQGDLQEILRKLEELDDVQDELWCQRNCETEGAQDCRVRSCDGAAQTCDDQGPARDGTPCAGGRCVGGECKPVACSAGACNLGWFRDEEGVVRIAAADGSELSLENPGWVTVPSKDPAGGHVTLKVTEPPYFYDRAYGDSDLADWSFGVTADRAWNDWMPIFLYAVNSDDKAAGLAFGFSRSPAMSRTPVNEGIGGPKWGAPSPPGQGDVFLVPVSPLAAIAAYRDCPAALIGASQMRKPGVDADWELATTDAHAGGIGQGAIDAIIATMWDMPSGQNGATAGTHFLPVGDVAGPWTSQNLHVYTLNRDGYVRGQFMFDGTTGTASTSTGTVRLAGPYAARSQRGTYSYRGGGRLSYGPKAVASFLCYYAQQTAGVDFQVMAGLDPADPSTPDLPRALLVKDVNRGSESISFAGAYAAKVY